MIVAVDFDGTCVTHEYPKVGRDVGAVPVLKRLSENGHKLILLTMRSGKTLDDAVEWFRQNDIELYGVNENPDKHVWTESRKVYAHIYIDDASLGIPLTEGLTGERSYVNWKEAERLLSDLF